MALTCRACCSLGLLSCYVFPWEGRAGLTPKIDTSTCPPRIIPNDSGLSKVDAPGMKVTVSFPALMMSLRLRVSTTATNAWGDHVRVNLILGRIRSLAHTFSRLVCMVL